jgi:hypothetical protein
MLVIAAILVLSANLPLASAVYAGEPKIADIVIKDGKVVGKKSLRVTQGDSVVLRWSSDRRLTVHLHGYDVHTTVSPGTPSEMKIHARTTGRFPVEVHGHGEKQGGHGHTAIFHLDVYPN